MNVFGNEITSSNGKKRQRSNAVVGVAKRGVATAQPVRPGGGEGVVEFPMENFHFKPKRKKKACAVLFGARSRFVGGDVGLMNEAGTCFFFFG